MPREEWNLSDVEALLGVGDIRPKPFSAQLFAEKLRITQIFQAWLQCPSSLWFLPGIEPVGVSSYVYVYNLHARLHLRRYIQVAATAVAGSYYLTTQLACECMGELRVSSLATDMLIRCLHPVVSATAVSAATASSPMTPKRSMLIAS